MKKILMNCLVLTIFVGSALLVGLISDYYFDFRCYQSLVFSAILTFSITYLFNKNRKNV